MRLRLACAAALVLMTVSGTASARDIPGSGFTEQDVAAWLQSKGYPAEIVNDSGNVRSIRSSSNGVPFGIYMLNCHGDDCESMQFSAGFATQGTLDASRMNEWNHEARWTRCYFNAQNNPFVEYDVDLTPGGTYEMLDDEFKIWISSLAHFVDRYGLK